MAHFKPTPLQREALNAYLRDFVNICCIEGFCETPEFKGYDVRQDPNKFAHDYREYLLSQPNAEALVKEHTANFIKNNPDLVANEIADCTVSKAVRGENKYNVIMPRAKITGLSFESKTNQKRRTAILAELIQEQFGEGVKLPMILQDDRFIVTAGNNTKLTDLLQARVDKLAQAARSK